MKAQVVKNAVIVATGAKGGFYPSNCATLAARYFGLPKAPNYRIFIRACFGHQTIWPGKTITRKMVSATTTILFRRRRH